MADIPVMKIVRCIHNLLHNPTGCLLIAAIFVLGDEVKQFCSSRIFHHYIDVLFVLESLVEFNNIWIVC